MVVTTPPITPASPQGYSLKITDRVNQTITALETKSPSIAQKLNQTIRSFYKQPFPEGTRGEETEIGIIYTYQIKEVKYEITYSVREEIIQILRVDNYVAEL